MSTAQIQYTVPELLIRAGATLRPHDRADCPKCGKRRAVSYTSELYFCHHAGCAFSGNDFRLARSLGFLLPPSPGEFTRRMEAHRRAKQAAAYLKERIRRRVHVLRAEHRQLLGIEDAGQEQLKRNPGSTLGRDMASYAKGERRKVLAALTILEDSPVPQRVVFLDANTEQREGRISRVVADKGIYNVDQKFIPVEV